MVLSPLLLAFQAAGDLRRTFAAGAREAALMAPPETVCGAQAVQMLWTATGRNLVVFRRADGLTAADAAALMGGKPPRLQAKNEIVVWNLQARRARTVLSIRAETSSLDDLAAVPGTDNVVVSMSEQTFAPNGAHLGETRSISLLSADTGSAIRLSTMTESEEGFESAEISPTRPLIAIRRFRQNPNTNTVRFFGLAGKGSPAFTLPSKAQLIFDGNGMPGYIVRGEAPAKPGAKPRFQFHKIDPVTGKAGALVDFVLPEDKDVVPRFVVDDVPSVALDPKVSAPGIFLQVAGGKEGESGIVSTDGAKPLLSPKLDAVAYVSQGSAMVRGLATMPRAMYDAAKRDADKQVVMSNAKQVGLAMLMYAADMDDVLPGQGDDIRKTLEPYTKNSKLFEGFTYTFGGGDLNSVAKPAETEVGFVNGPGGRAVIYADGHVRWQTDAP